MLKELFTKASELAGGQEKLGEMLGIPQSRVSEFKNYKGKGRKPSDTMIAELALFVGWNPIETVLACKPETEDKEKASLWLNWLNEYEWRPHGDSNPGYRRERAMSLFKVWQILQAISQIVRGQMRVFLCNSNVTMPQKLHYIVERDALGYQKTSKCMP